MKQSDHFRENAENTAQLAELAINEAAHKRYNRMEAAWIALADEQDWLDGEISYSRSTAAPGPSGLLMNCHSIAPDSKPCSLLKGAVDILPKISAY